MAKLRFDGGRLAAGNIANALLHNGDVRSLIENAVGGSGSDTITGNQAANLLKGNGGNDTLSGGSGNDTLDGGSGTDTAIFSGRRSQYAVLWKADGSIQISDLRSGAPDGINFAWSIELYQFADRLYDATELKTSSSSETFSTTSLTSVEPAPNPVVTEPIVNDLVVETPTLAEPEPADLTVSGSDSNDTLYGGTGSDKLYGRDGNDILIGGAGGDYLSGGRGIDAASYVSARTGVVTSLISPTANRGDAAGDTYSSIESLIGSAYADKLVGNGGANIIKGGAGNDRLYGQGGNDVLYGGEGSDILNGGPGKDVLYGGSGADIFVFTALSHSRGSSIDTVKDFGRGSDRIDLRSIDANTKANGNQAFSFIGKSAFSGKAGQLQFIKGVLSGDVNGDKVADFQIKVAGLSTLSKADFYL